MCQRGDLLQIDFKNITRRYMLQIQRNVRKGNITNLDWINLTKQNVTYVDQRNVTPKGHVINMDLRNVKRRDKLFRTNIQKLTMKGNVPWTKEM